MAQPDETKAFELDAERDAKFIAEQTVIDEQISNEYASVLKYLEESAAHMRETIPNFNCSLSRADERNALFTYKESSVDLNLVKSHLPERGRDWALSVAFVGGKENKYRPYPHEEGLVWICDNPSGEDLVGVSKDFANKIVEKCSRES